MSVGVVGHQTRAPRLLYPATKRLLDVAGAAVLLVLFLPALILIAVAVRLTSPGPALFRQERVGFGERPFVFWKFRTMHVDSDDTIHRAYVTRLLQGDRQGDRPPDGGEAGVYKLAADPRVTPFGSVLRRTSLDELPQLVNVLRGEMSLVGPRPCLAWEAQLYRPAHRRRFEAKPGMTGLWQVNGRSRCDMLEQLDLDVAYVQRRSLGLDLAILAKTVPSLIRDRSAR